jgi:heme/copper-type cytochrome/quinol oxidase subunit 2
MSAITIAYRILLAFSLFLLFQIGVFVIVFLVVFLYGEPNNAFRYAGLATVSAICWAPPMIIMLITIVLVSCSKDERRISPKESVNDT